MTLPIARPPAPAGASRSSGAGGCGRPRASTRGRWRTLVLASIHVLFAAHFAHWWFAGRTLSPCEPSEAMQTLELGLVNCGFVLFVLAILSTLVLGRWFCGWGCHIVAVQDLSTWILKKLRFRPQPFRSRLLVFAPLLAALYMFVWPTVARLWADRPPPVLLQHFFTQDFWQTFPGPVMSIVTLVVCGFIIVVLLGNKGYCTYACPYGGFFGLVEPLAPGRIRVTDACDQCGHCTAACTSNVRVHEEVHRRGMVVDPGCMKCTDCISVCPKGALYFGFAAPPAFNRKERNRAARTQSRTPRAFDYTWGEEAALAALFLASLYAWRGLYDAVPFLLALGLAAISAYLLVQLGRLAYARHVKIHRVQLRRAGRVTPAGWVCGVGLVALAAFIAHAFVLQVSVREGERLLAESQRVQAASAGAGESATRAAAARAVQHLNWVDRLALIPMSSTHTQLASLHLYLGDLEQSEQHLRRALAIAPRYGAAQYKYAELLARRGQREEALRRLQHAVELDPSLSDARRQLAEALEHSGRSEEAERIIARVAERRPHDAEAHVLHALLLAGLGRADEARAALNHAIRLRPEMERRRSVIAPAGPG